MVNANDVAQFLRENCPNLWSILNRKTQCTPPDGYVAFLSGDWAKEGEELLLRADKRIAGLIRKISLKEVGDKYRSDLSGADSEDKLAELFCEISLADSLSSISTVVPKLRPKNESGTACDVKVGIEGNDLYAESKRLEDRWKGGIRSIAKSPPEARPKLADKPRSMDLYSKLKDTPRQFPNDTLNVIFLFHRSIGSSQLYIKQALFGDGTGFSEFDQLSLSEDGLYSLRSWQEISACAFVRVNFDGAVSIVDIWKNPKARHCLPDKVVVKLKDLR